MPLDMTLISRQIVQMGEALKAREQTHIDHLGVALSTLHARSDADRLAERVATSQTSWLVAIPCGESLDLCVPAPPAPRSYTVIATDGSQIEPNRHASVLCYLLNVGSATLHYGDHPKALLRNTAALHYSDDDLFITSNNRQIPIQGQLLAVKRQISELRMLLDLVKTLPQDIPTAEGPILTLQDGTLILWPLTAATIDDHVRETLLQEFLACLDEMRWANLPVASYISRPRSTDVVNALRVARCPYPTATCSRYCSHVDRNREAPCSDIYGVLDRDLFAGILDEGERSALFKSDSSISRDRYLENKIVFFYLNVGKEIARVELPEWVATNPDLLNRVHALVYDQCRRGRGYPPALIEAHEKAVIDQNDRHQFQMLLDTILVRNGLPLTISAKSRAKQYHGA